SREDRARGKYPPLVAPWVLPRRRWQANRPGWWRRRRTPLIFAAASPVARAPGTPRPGPRPRAEAPATRPSGASLDTPVDAVGRQVRGLVGEPDPLPLVLDLPQVLGDVEQLEDAPVGIGRVDVDEAARVAKHAGGREGQEQTPHEQPPRTVQGPSSPPV